jgi:hypothetical protein
VADALGLGQEPDLGDRPRDARGIGRGFVPAAATGERRGGEGERR